MPDRRGDKRGRGVRRVIPASSPSAEALSKRLPGPVEEPAEAPARARKNDIAKPGFSLYNFSDGQGSALSAPGADSPAAREDP